MHALRKPASAAEFEEVLQYVRVIVDNEQQRKELLASAGNDAQEWLDLFQLLVEYLNIATKLRSWIFKLMISLSRKSGLHPQCLMIREVQKLGQYPVGGGAFGDVWKGKVGQQLVCLKVIRAFETSDLQKILKDYMQEAIIWRQMNHPNVLPFMGVYYLDSEQKQLALVSPWMERGNLVQYLKNTPSEDVDHDLLAYDVACGLSYLHEANIVHADLKGVNILITPDLRACIGDFGLSRVSATQLLLSETSRSNGTPRWLSPELMNPGPNCFPSRESDVYAYACVCYEIFAGRVPFYEMPEATIVLVVVMKKQRPSRPEDCAKLHNWMWDTMVQCWNEDPSSRPTIVDVLALTREKNANRGLELASKWDNPSFTHIWNDPQHPPVIHAVEPIPAREIASHFAQSDGVAPSSNNFLSPDKGKSKSDAFYSWEPGHTSQNQSPRIPYAGSVRQRQAHNQRLSGSQSMPSRYQIEDEERDASAIFSDGRSSSVALPPANRDQNILRLVIGVNIILDQLDWPSPPPVVHVTSDNKLMSFDIRLSPLTIESLFCDLATYPLASMDPTITLSSPFPLAPQCSYSVFEGGAGLPFHREVASLECQSNPMQSSGWMYCASLIPEMWEVLCKSPSPTQYTMTQDLFAADASGARSEPYATLFYRFTHQKSITGIRAQQQPQSPPRLRIYDSDEDFPQTYGVTASNGNVFTPSSDEELHQLSRFLDGPIGAPLDLDWVQQLQRLLSEQKTHSPHRLSMHNRGEDFYREPGIDITISGENNENPSSQNDSIQRQRSRNLQSLSSSDGLLNSPQHSQDSGGEKSLRGPSLPISGVGYDAGVSIGPIRTGRNRPKPHEDIFLCPVPQCGSTFSGSFGLDNHINSWHDKEKPFVCLWPGCGKGFARRRDWGRHTLTHTMYPPTCEGCQRSFKRTDALDRHRAECQRLPQ